MKVFKRLRAFLRSVPLRATGSWVQPDHDGVTRLHSSAPAVDEDAALSLAQKPRLVGVMDGVPFYRYQLEDYEDLPLAKRPER